ncbi:hypothetical protein H0H92_009525 [Tricholoma furcatifolium]|nr:hypothetical protein H0H92_009525 [Tricholoma furcatifolium]
MAPHSHPSGKKFYLFGYPIAHSAAPTLHNHSFMHWPEGRTNPNTYELWSTSKVTDEMLSALSREDCGGCAVTMPIKAAMLPYLDEISAESQITGACNTIVKVPTSTGYKLVGQNTDSVRNALLRALRSQFPDRTISSEASYPSAIGAAGVIIGGGATTRSAAHALTILGLSPLYILNRDLAEVQAVQASLSHINIIHLKNSEDVEAHLGSPNSPQVLMVVGAIPAIPPLTPQERTVYSTASTILTIPYTKPEGVNSELPIPERRIFLEMAYKPRLTPMLKVAMAHGWHGVDGVQATVEQGLAQHRMWYLSDPSLKAGSDRSVFDIEMEHSTRDLGENMPEIIPVGVEIDKACINDDA